jgi:hypothetical protein
MPLPTPEPVSIIAGLLGGGVLGAFAAHRLNIHKERRDRRNEFRGFLRAWLNGIRREPNVWKCYGPDNLEHFCRYSGKLASDFFFHRRFKTMSDDLASLKQQDIQGDPERYRELIARKIEALIEFV